MTTLKTAFVIFGICLCAFLLFYNLPTGNIDVPGTKNDSPEVPQSPRYHFRLEKPCRFLNAHFPQVAKGSESYESIDVDGQLVTMAHGEKFLQIRPEFISGTDISAPDEPAEYVLTIDSTPQAPDAAYRLAKKLARFVHISDALIDEWYSEKQYQSTLGSDCLVSGETRIGLHEITIRTLGFHPDKPCYVMYKIYFSCEKGTALEMQRSED